MRRTTTRLENGSRRTVGFLVLVTALTVTPALARAQIVVIDPAAIARLAAQVQQTMQHIAVTQNQLRLQIANMQKLSNPNWRAIAGTMSQVDGLTQNGAAIWYSLGSVGAQFRQTYPGWQVSSTMASDLQTQQQRTLATLRSAVDMANVTSQQLSVASSRLSAMKAQIGSIASAQEAAELTGAISIHAAEELTLLRQQLVAQGNAESVFLAHQINRDAQAAAVANAFSAAGATTPIRQFNMSVGAVGIP